MYLTSGDDKCPTPTEPAPSSTPSPSSARSVARVRRMVGRHCLRRAYRFIGLDVIVVQLLRVVEGQRVHEEEVHEEEQQQLYEHQIIIKIDKKDKNKKNKSR